MCEGEGERQAGRKDVTAQLSDLGKDTRRMAKSACCLLDVAYGLWLVARCVAVQQVTCLCTCQLKKPGDH